MFVALHKIKYYYYYYYLLLLLLLQYTRGRQRALSNTARLLLNGSFLNEPILLCSVQIMHGLECNKAKAHKSKCHNDKRIICQHVMRIRQNVMRIR